MRRAELFPLLSIYIWFVCYFHHMNYIFLWYWKWYFKEVEPIFKLRKLAEKFCLAYTKFLQQTGKGVCTSWHWWGLLCDVVVGFCFWFRADWGTICTIFSTVCWRWSRESLGFWCFVRKSNSFSARFYPFACPSLFTYVYLLIIFT